MSIQEKREALQKSVHLCQWQVAPAAEGVANANIAEAMRLADAYALQAHVDACGRKTGERSDTDSTEHVNRALLCCGDGWYCDKAREIKELGK